MALSPSSLRSWCAGIVGSTWRPIVVIETTGSEIPELYTEFFTSEFYWNNHHHMLHAVKRSWRQIIGCKPPVIILVIPGSLCNCLDGRKSFYTMARGGLWCCTAYECHLIYIFIKNTHTQSRKKMKNFAKAFGKDEKKTIDAALCYENHCCIFQLTLSLTFMQ